MRNEYLNREPIEEGLNIPVSVWQEIEDYYDESEQKALEYILLIGRYCFFGDEPNEETTSRDVLRSIRALIPHIDNQRMRYRKAKLGGKGNSVMSDEEFIKNLKENNYKTQADAGRAIGISRQAVGQKLKKLGVSLSGYPLSTNTTQSSVPKKHLDSVLQQHFTCQHWKLLVHWRRT